MASYKATIVTPHSPQEVWRYLADLRSVAEWDPSVDDARLVEGEPATAGSRYELKMSLLGRTATLPYRTIEIEPGQRVVFGAETSTVSVRDEARISSASAGGSTVTWAAELQPRGLWRILGLPLRAAFCRIGRRAERGLIERLSESRLSGSPLQVRA